MRLLNGDLIIALGDDRRKDLKGQKWSSPLEGTYQCKVKWGAHKVPSPVKVLGLESLIGAFPWALCQPVDWIQCVTVMVVGQLWEKMGIEYN